MGNSRGLQPAAPAPAPVVWRAAPSPAAAPRLRPRSPRHFQGPWARARPQQHLVSTGCLTLPPPLSGPPARPCSLVVRFTNRNVVCQIAYATMAGDKVICAAYRCVPGAMRGASWQRGRAVGQAGLEIGVQRAGVRLHSGWHRGGCVSPRCERGKAAQAARQLVVPQAPQRWVVT